MRKKSKIVNKGPFLVDESFRGVLSEHSVAVVMDNTISRNPETRKKVKVSYIIAQNANLWAGQNTVALFKIKKRFLS